MHRILNFGDIELDAKKSPLALLAQTCSSIGKPESGSKPIIPPIEKKDVPSTSGSSSSSSDKKEGAPSSSSAGKSTPDRSSPPSRHNAASGRASSRDGVGAEKSLRAASASPASSPNGSAPSYRPYGTPKTTPEDGSSVATTKDDNVAFRTPRPSGGSHKGEKPSPTGTATSSDGSPKSDSSPSSSDAAASSSSSSAHGASSTSSSSYPQSSSVPSTTSSNKLTDVAADKNASSSSPRPPGASALAGLASAQAAGYSSLYPYGPMFDPSSPAFQAALAMHGGLFNHPAYLKSATTAPHAPPSCPHPGGCTQCEPSFPAAAAAAAAGAAAGFPPHPPHPSLNLHHSAAAAAAAAALGLPYPFLPPGGLPPPPSALATTTASPFGSPYSSLNSQNANNSRLPFICNWVMPHDSFCGKRFATSEELLQHLRTHTSAANAAASEAAAAASSSSLLNSSYPGGFSQAAAMAAAFPGGLSAHGAAAAAAAAHALSSSALSSPNSPLRRSYPTSLSPVSRYHPYKPPSSSSVPTAANSHAPPPFPGLPHFPGLGPYYSPYANLYGPRLGAPLAPP